MPRPIRLPLLALILAIASVAPPPNTHADTLQLTNGTEFQGRLIAADDQQVVFEVHTIGARMTLRRPPSQVKQIIKQSRQGPAYAVLALNGPIGRDLDADSFITADAFHQALNEIRAAKPKYVILEIDSPGGQITEMQRIIKAIDQADELSFIAHVHDAHSAAAVIAMTCPTIVMAPNSSIGAAVPFTISPDGTPTNIQEKWLSAIRAGMRNAAIIGGHSPMLIRGMSEIDIELALTEQNGQPTVVLAGDTPDDPTQANNTRPLKAKGQILTLTADEALRCGLSTATITTRDQIRQHLDLDAWHPVLTYATDYIREQSQADKKHQAAIQSEARRIALQDEFHQKQQAQRIDIHNQLADLYTQIRADRIAEQGLVDQWNKQRQDLVTKYQKLHNHARKARDPRAAAHRLDAEYYRERSKINEQHEQKLQDLREKIQAATTQAENIQKRHKNLIDTPNS